MTRPSARSTTIARTVRRLLRERGAAKTICPSEVARAVDPTGWRLLMPAVRAEIARLVDRDEVVVMQRGRVVDVRKATGPIRVASADVDRRRYVDAYRGVDFRKHPERYRVGRGEQGVLVAEPYKSELLPLWRFRTEAAARRSVADLWKAFVGYRRARDFVGMDMARKYLQMGFTRARRYANRRSGRKYAARDVGTPRSARATLARDPDREKARAAAVFHAAWQRAERDRSYAAWRARHAVTNHPASTTARRRRRASR
jgi:hypothetical protein